MSQLSDQISREAGIKVLHQATQTISLVKSKELSILPNRREQLLADIRHLQVQLGRLSESANKIYAEVLSLTIE